MTNEEKEVLKQMKAEEKEIENKLREEKRQQHIEEIQLRKLYKSERINGNYAKFVEKLGLVDKQELSKYDPEELKVQSKKFKGKSKIAIAAAVFGLAIFAPCFILSTIGIGVILTGILATTGFLIAIPSVIVSDLMKIKSNKCYNMARYIEENKDEMEEFKQLTQRIEKNEELQAEVEKETKVQQKNGSKLFRKKVKQNDEQKLNDQSDELSAE